MKRRIEFWPLLLMFLATGQVFLAREKAQPENPKAHITQQQASDTQKKNIQEYIDLLGSNVQHEKHQIMGAMLQLNEEDAAKFWPIYAEYDAELTKLNKVRADNIQEFARSYNQITDEKANEFVKTDLETMKQRVELLTKYYEQLKDPLGAVNAARFMQIENQLLSITDLQIDSSLPMGEE